MTTFKFETEKDAAVKVLDPVEGSFKTYKMAATIEYYFTADDLISLSISDQWFNMTDIDELISFLNAVKEQLK